MVQVLVRFGPVRVLAPVPAVMVVVGVAAAVTFKLSLPSPRIRFSLSTPKLMSPVKSVPARVLALNV